MVKECLAEQDRAQRVLKNEDSAITQKREVAVRYGGRTHKRVKTPKSVCDPGTLSSEQVARSGVRIYTGP